ncbi:parafibromin isoform X1 [Cryptotermes secundus]|uniref:parafibromin isoform X1 n=1 Tax=Cryptotermes secundus TaxID=105785 RepID=UPI001454CDD3|nr:parafibromin isoform X1 [Cryptotermes secundus]
MKSNLSDTSNRCSTDLVKAELQNMESHKIQPPDGSQAEPGAATGSSHPHPSLQQRMKLQGNRSRYHPYQQGSGSSQQSRSLSEAMSIEKIVAIKAKHLAMKRTTIKGTDDIGLGSDHHVMLDFDVAATKYIISRERQGRTRTTVLQSTGKIFEDNIFAMLQSVINREGREDRCPQPSPVIPRNAPIQSIPQPTMYSRYDQERFIRHTETGGFKIDTLSTYCGMIFKSMTEGTQPKKVQTPSQQIIPQLRPVAEPKIAVRRNKKISRTPIIIIPPATTPLITMYNAKDLLQDLRFVSSEEKKRQGAKKENEFLLMRRKGGLTVPYQVIDNPQKLKNADWDRVVAVFVMGPTWQFKGWPWDGNPVKIFSKICAFHVKYDEMKLDANVSGWAVHIIEVSRTKRHLDYAALMTFWERLDRYMIHNKPHLRF